MSMELAKNLYAKMPDVFAKARKKFGRGLTLAEKVLVSHADNFDTQTWERGKAMLALRPDRVAMQHDEHYDWRRQARWSPWRCGTIL